MYPIMLNWFQTGIRRNALDFRSELKKCPIFSVLPGMTGGGGTHPKSFGCLKIGALSFQAEMPGIGRIPGISNPESIFCPVLSFFLRNMTF